MDGSCHHHTVKFILNLGKFWEHLNIEIFMIFTRVFSKIEFFLKNFSEFTGKDLSQSLFFNKIAGLAIGKDVLL